MGEKEEVNRTAAQGPEAPPAAETGPAAAEAKEGAPTLGGMSPRQVRELLEAAEEVKWEPVPEWTISSALVKIKAYRAKNDERLWKFVCKVRGEGKEIIYAYRDGNVYRVLASLASLTPFRERGVYNYIALDLKLHFGIELDWWPPRIIMAEKDTVIAAVEGIPVERALLVLTAEGAVPEPPFLLPTWATMAALVKDDRGDYRIVCKFTLSEHGVEVVG
jgi:hypothetical protein